MPVQYQLQSIRPRATRRKPMSSAPIETAVGAISGTSMDGIDVSLVRSDGRDTVEPGPGRTYDYPPALRAKLIELIADPVRAETDPLAAIEAEVSDAHAAAIAAFLEDFAIDRS